MKHSARILAVAVALFSLAACSNESGSTTKKPADTPTTVKAAKQDRAVIDAAFAIDTAIRTAAKEAAGKDAKNVNTQKAEFVTSIDIESELKAPVSVFAASDLGTPVLVWKDGKAVKPSKELAGIQTQLEISGNGNAVCMRLARDASLFITDVPAMKEQLTQFKTASGITKITLDGSAACAWSK